MSAVDIIDAEVRDAVRRQGVDPLVEPAAVRRIVGAVVTAYDERSLTTPLPALGDPRDVERTVFDAVAGFGPLQPYLDDPTVEEIWINEPSKVFVARHGRSELTTTILREDEVRDLVEKMLKTSRSPGRPVLAVRRRDAPGRQPPPRRHPRHHAPAPRRQRGPALGVVAEAGSW